MRLPKVRISEWMHQNREAEATAAPKEYDQGHAGPSRLQEPHGGVYGQTCQEVHARVKAHQLSEG